MTHGFKDKNKKFHPITNNRSVRKKRSPSTMQGVKIVKYVDPNTQKSREMLEGISQSFARQPASVKKNVNTIVLRQKGDGEDFTAITDSKHGIVFFNQRDDLTKDDYEALGDHEFQHIDFAKHLNDKDKEYLDFVINGNRIMPFTPSLVSTVADQEEAFVQGNFGILPDKRLEYPDEINSVVTEIETRNKLGLPNQILNEEEFRKAKELVEKLHEND